MKKTAIAMTVLALASASWGIEYDTSWMGAYTWTDRSDRLENNPFGLGPSEARPLHFTGTDYITLSNQAHFQPLVLDGTIYLSGGNRLSGKLTAVISGSVRANNTLWIGENNQILDVSNAEFYGLTNARGCVPLVVAPDAHVTFR